MEDFDKIRKAMESLRSHDSWPYLKHFLESEKQSSLNSAKSASADDTLRSMGKYQAFERVQTFVMGN